MRRLLFGIIIISVAFSACKNSINNSNTLIIFHAGSLSMPMKAIADSFIAENPEVKILMEAAGSVECARKITEIKREADIMASADYKIIDDLLIPEYATHNVLFAGNELTLVHTPKSKYAQEINSDNWFEILLRPDVHFGRSDPNADPCGYRTLLTLKLAQVFYNKPNIAEAIEQKDNRFIRPKEVDLLALLETGAIDYIFLYRSVAVQHGLEFLVLPSEINLGNPKYSSFYAQASVTIRGSSPSDTLVITGEPMVYGITIPTNSPNRPLAKKYLEFFLHPDKGLKIIERMGMPLVMSLPAEDGK
jgi:molybdate/tungstate transport system substrate-binding protein